MFAAALLIVIIGYAGVRLALGLPIIGQRELHGFVLDEPYPVGNFTLTDQNGERVELRDFRDQLVLLYFGYTFCPDVCPETLAQVARALEELTPRQREQIQVLMVTVDPDRDTPEVLKEYLGYFDPTFIGLTGTPEEINAAAAPMGIYYARVDADSAAGYFMDHTATLALLDRDGRWLMALPYGVAYDDIASDLRYFLRQ
jgi:protein SCO1/2